LQKAVKHQLAAEAAAVGQLLNSEVMAVLVLLSLDIK